MPTAISVRTGSRAEAGGGGGSGVRIPSSSTADTTNVIASRTIAIGAVSTEIRKPLMPKPANSLADQLAASAEFASHEALPFDDRRQVGVVGRVEERGQDRRQRGHEEHVPERQDAGHERDGDGGEQDRPAEVRPDEDRAPPEPVHPCTGDEPDDEARPDLEATEDGNLERTGAKRRGSRRMAAPSG